MTEHSGLSTAGYRPSTILVTGGCGFIGTNLVRYLAGKGHRIRVLDNLSTPSPEWAPDLPSAPHSPPTQQTQQTQPTQQTQSTDLVVGDIRDRGVVEKAIEGVEAVVHLAAHTSVVESLEKPGEAWDINVNGTLSLLEACRCGGVDRFVLASSNAVVGEQEPPIDETRLPRPLSPYGASKLAGEALCSAYYHSFALKTVALRFANCYGPHAEHKPSVIARFIDWARRGEPLVVYGDGSQTRDFVHVADICQAIHLALTADSRPATAHTLQTQQTQATQQTPGTPQTQATQQTPQTLQTQATPGTPQTQATQQTPVWGEVFQIASGVETSINQLVDLIQAMADSPLPVVRKPGRKGEIQRNYSDITKAKRVLGFQPEVALREGLRGLWQAR